MIAGIGKEKNEKRKEGKERSKEMRVNGGQYRRNGRQKKKERTNIQTQKKSLKKKSYSVVDGKDRGEKREKWKECKWKKGGGKSKRKKYKFNASSRKME